MDKTIRSIFNRKILLESKQPCGCYYCCKVFSPTEIVEWCDQYLRKPTRPNQEDSWTALCPKCGIDSVIDDTTEEELKELNQRYFVD